jgi:hypothetical protein
MTNRPPPIPPHNLNPKASRRDERPDVHQHTGDAGRSPSTEKGDSANTKQNTRHQGYQQDR